MPACSAGSPMPEVNRRASAITIGWSQSTNSAGLVKRTRWDSCILNPLAAFEPGLPLLQEGRHALAEIRGPGRSVEGVALGVELGAQRVAERSAEQRLDAAIGLGRPGSQFARQRHGF